MHRGDDLDNSGSLPAVSSVPLRILLQTSQTGNFPAWFQAVAGIPPQTSVGCLDKEFGTSEDLEMGKDFSPSGEDV